MIPLSHFTVWLARGERGLSSDAIVSRLTGEEVGRPMRIPSHPYDPADFRRCQLLLRAVPLAGLVFPTVMRDVSPEWARLVDAWGEIHAAIEEEVPGYLDGNRGTAQKGYALMRRVIEGKDR